MARPCAGASRAPHGGHTAIYAGELVGSAKADFVGALLTACYHSNARAVRSALAGRAIGTGAPHASTCTPLPPHARGKVASASESTSTSTSTSTSASASASASTSTSTSTRYSVVLVGDDEVGFEYECAVTHRDASPPHAHTHAHCSATNGTQRSRCDHHGTSLEFMCTHSDRVSCRVVSTGQLLWALARCKASADALLNTVDDELSLVEMILRMRR